MEETIRAYLTEFGLLAGVAANRVILTDAGRAYVDDALNRSYELWAEYEELIARGMQPDSARMVVLATLSATGI